MAVLLVYGVLSYGIHRFVVFPSYVGLERFEAQKDLNRCIEALRREIHHLNALAHDWAAWDDAYEFVADLDAEFIESNLQVPTFVDNKLNVVVFLDLEGCVLWRKVLDFRTRTELDVPEFSRDRFATSHPFLKHTLDMESSVSGVYLTGKGPLLAASRPIIRSLHIGPARGYLILGRFLDEQYMKTLADQTKVDHKYWPAGSDSIPRDGRAAFDKLRHDPVPVFEEHNANSLFVYDIFDGLTDDSALLARADISRQIMKNARNTMFFVLVSTLFAGIALLFVMFFLLRNVVIHPLGKLTARVISFRDSQYRLPALYLHRNDEIGMLCREFHRLLNKLTRFHKGLKKTNARLRHEIGERGKYEQKLQSQRARLRHLAYELLITEERERRRLAADLHDQISQNLALCQLKVAILTESEPSSAMIDELGKIEEQLEGIIQDTRTLTFEISPPILYELGLKAALEWLAEKTEATSGIKIGIEGDSDGVMLDNSLNILIFRTVRELLHNVVKHSKASRATVRISPGEEFLQISVSDDGVGFAPDKQNKNAGYGIFSIRERFGSIGGEFAIKSEIGAGTQAVLKAPCKGRTHED